MAVTKKDYAAIAASKVRKPGEKPPRILVYGRNKKGKTTFGASAPRVLIIDPEEGTDYVNGDPDVWPVAEWKDMEDVFQYLKTKDAQDKYDWVHVDGLTRITNMALRFVMNQAEERDLDRQPGMVQLKDYGKSGELVKGMLFNFHNLPFGIVYTAQERQESGGSFGSEDEDAEDADVRYVPDLPKGVRSSVNAIVDVIGRIYVVKVDATTKSGKDVTVAQRRLWVGQAESQDTGYRSKFALPDTIKNPTVPKLTEMMTTGKVTK